MQVHNHLQLLKQVLHIPVVLMTGDLALHRTTKSHFTNPKSQKEAGNARYWKHILHITNTITRNNIHCPIY